MTPRGERCWRRSRSRPNSRERLDYLRNTQAGGSAAPGATHPFRPGDDPRAGATATASRTTPLSFRAGPPASTRRRYDYLPANSLLVIDECTSAFRRSARCSRATARARRPWWGHGFRLPSALDNRPLRFEEWEAVSPQDHLRLHHPGCTRRNMPGGSSSRWCVPPGWSIRRSRYARR